MLGDPNVKGGGPEGLGRLKEALGFLAGGPGAPVERPIGAPGGPSIGRRVERPISFRAGESLAGKALKGLWVVVTLGAAAVATRVVYDREPDAWLTAFAFLVTAFAVASLFDVAISRRPVVKILHVATLPLFTTWLLIGSHQSLERWWAATLIGLGLGVLAFVWASRRAFPDVVARPRHPMWLARLTLPARGRARMPTRCVRCGRMLDGLQEVQIGGDAPPARRLEARSLVPLGACRTCVEADETIARWRRVRNRVLVGMVAAIAVSIGAYVLLSDRMEVFDGLATAALIVLVAVLIVPRVNPTVWQLQDAVQLRALAIDESGAATVVLAFDRSEVAEELAALNDGHVERSTSV